jgi:hypothetical protein
MLAIASSIVLASACAAKADPAKFMVELTGAEQVPPVQTSGAGKAALTYDPANRMVTWSISYTGLSGPVTMAHFHGPASAGKNGPVTVWLAKQGSPVQGDITGSATLTPDQAEEFAAGQWYINLHTKDHPDGEIRGQVAPPKN